MAFQMAEFAIARILFADIRGWSRSCGRHQRSHRREALNCFAFVGAWVPSCRGLKQQLQLQAVIRRDWRCAPCLQLYIAPATKCLLCTLCNAKEVLNHAFSEAI